ncbi:hypothetical protein M9H77_30366 [Catharanthus roseus]|uniref:Uncharacterized protein n=1 Tax=Catharanthus roseus TaxID=4058 RepID=A0ACB9ZXW2_CATRO|nr:hypothetical protein M9H77_30366 [Catharanthus roseus]
MEIIPNLFNNIGWVSLLTVDELYYLEMIYEFYTNLHKGRAEKDGNITRQWVLSRIGGRDITFDYRLFYTKNKKCFDPNLYNERRFEEIFTKREENELWFYGHRAYVATQSSSTKYLSYGCFLTKIFHHFVLNLVGVGGQNESDKDDEEEDDDGEQKEMNADKEESDTEPEVKTHRREIRQKKRQEKTKEGSSSVDMAQLMARIITMQPQLNS